MLASSTGLTPGSVSLLSHWLPPLVFLSALSSFRSHSLCLSFLQNNLSFVAFRDVAGSKSPGGSSGVSPFLHPTKPFYSLAKPVRLESEDIFLHLTPNRLSLLGSFEVILFKMRLGGVGAKTQRPCCAVLASLVQ